MPTQNIHGRGFEYTCLDAIYEKLKLTDMHCEINVTNTYLTAKRNFYELDSELQNKMNLAAKSSLKTLFNFEPNLSNGREKITLSIAEDQRGEYGDVRDVLMVKNESGWEIGISCKHNHAALKHSRLSNEIDFGDRWFGIPASSKYFSDIAPIFSRLKNLREQTRSLDRSLQNKWSMIENKENEIYVPVLNAFKNELLRLYTKHQSSIPRALIEYLLGKKDFYKVIAKDNERKTIVQSFNLSETLSQPYGNIKPRSKATRFGSILPTRIYDFDFKQNSLNTLELIMDNGWQISFRIHNASSRIEPSLKFDIQLVGMPQSITNVEEFWSEE